MMSELENEDPAPWAPQQEFTAAQVLLARARAHLGEGFRQTCLAAPQYSTQGRDELMKAEALLVELAELLAAASQVKPG